MKQRVCTNDFHFYFILGRSLNLLQANETGSYLISNNGIIDKDPPEFISLEMHQIKHSSTEQNIATTLFKPHIGISTILFKAYLKPINLRYYINTLK